MLFISRPDTTKMADVLMQVPAPFPTPEEKERLVALEVSASYPSRNSRYITAKGTMMDFLCAMNVNCVFNQFQNVQTFVFQD